MIGGKRRLSFPPYKHLCSTINTSVSLSLPIFHLSLQMSVIVPSMETAVPYSEYFLGYKLGLTATPKDYIKNIDVERLKATDPRAWEKRQLLDSYKTFGCESGDPTYRYSLLDGVRDGYLINPTVVDARTDITTKLLADEGYAVISQGDEANKNRNKPTLPVTLKEVFLRRNQQDVCQNFYGQCTP